VTRCWFTRAVFVDHAAAIAELALEFWMPTIGLFPIYAKAGGLFPYGPNDFELFKQAGGIAAKILRWAQGAPTCHSAVAIGADEFIE
jgi:hypothetical protein